MKKFTLISAALAIILSLSAPANADHGGGLSWGTIIGGATGGLLGSQIGKGRGRLAATAGGALLGVIIGNNVQRHHNSYGGQGGRGHPQNGYHYHDPRQYESPHGYRNRRVMYQTVPYQNHRPRYHPRWGRGNIAQPYRPAVVQQLVQQSSNHCASGYTREYTTVITIAGQEKPAWGRACYMPDRTWSPVGSLNY